MADADSPAKVEFSPRMGGSHTSLFHKENSMNHDDPLTVAHAAMAAVSSLILTLHNKGVLKRSDIDTLILHATSILDSFPDPRIKAGAEYLRQHPQLND
jgi:hypothetical protein